LTHDEYVGSGTFSPDGRYALTGDYSGVAQFWDVSTGARSGPRLLHPGNIYSVSISPKGRYALIGGEASAAFMWDYLNHTKVFALQHSNAVWSTAFSPDGHLILTGDGGGHAILWDSRTGKRIGYIFKHNNTIASARFRPDGREIVTAGWDGFARIWPVPEPSLAGHLRRVALWVRSLTGQRLEINESVVALDASEWKEARRMLDDLGDPLRSP
jgi:WD40 repeat protein